MQNAIFVTTDYHMHSTFSPDGHNSPEEMCEQALKLGLKEISLTEHAEWHANSQGGGFPNVGSYFEAIATCQAKYEPLGLTLHAGVELGNPHQFAEEAMTLLANHPFDVVLASLHWLRDKNIHLEECFLDREADDVFADYFTELTRLVMGFDFDILSHFDRILWRATLMGSTFDPYRFEALIREALGAVARYGRTLELNTTYLTHQPNWHDALVTMLRWYLEEDGRQVVVNSDAHRTEEVARHRLIAQQLLIKAGFDLPHQLLRLDILPVESVLITSPSIKTVPSRFQQYFPDY